MKKSIKVLSLVLAIALICGAFVIGAFATKIAKEIATTDGVMVTTSANIENASATFVAAAKPSDPKTTTSTVQSASGINSALKADIVGRFGTLKVVSSQFEANKYLVYSKGEKGPKSGPFISSGYTQHDDNKAKNNVDTYNYQIIDFDVMFPEGNTVTSFTPTIQVRGYKADGTKAAPGLNTCTIKTVNGKVTLHNGLGAAVMTLPEAGWTHITGVYEFVSVSEAYIYLFVNDQLVNKGAFTASNLLNATQFWFSEMRWNFNENASSIALDNLSWRSIDSTKYAKMSELTTVLKAGVGASLSTWTDTLYEADKMPFGTLAATIGEGETAKYFDNLAKAIAAAEPGDTVTLKANSSETITVNKEITVKKNGFTAEFKPDKVAMENTDDAYVFVSTNAKMSVTVRPCGHGCIVAKTIQLYPGANIWDAIVEAYGAEPNCSYAEGDTNYVFDGFKVFKSSAPIIAEGDAFKKDLVVTDECATKSIVLEATYKAVKPTAQVYEADGTLVKTYYEGDTVLTLLNAAEAKAGRKIVLLADFVVDETAKYVEKGSTLDLNGYTLKFLRAPDATGKSGSSLLRIKADSTFTLTSSVVGGKIFEGAAYKKNNGASVPFAACEGANATLNVIGKNAAGETTLSYYGGVIVQAYGSRGSVNVDGGYYCRNRSDNFALFDMRVLSDCTFKNATFDAKLGATLALSGRDAGMGETTATVTVDNCDFIRGGVLNYASDKVTINFTNCVLGGDINPVVEGGDYPATPLTGDEIYIGKGCKLAAGITLHSKVNVVGAVAAVETLTYDVTNNNWGAAAVEDKLTLVDETVTVKIAKMVDDKITVTLTKDGKEYTVDAIAGMKAVTPATEVEGTKGMVNCSYTVAIPADAKDGDVIAIPDDAEKMYTAGKVPVLFNITITTHTSYNFYLPIVEGITYDAAAALTHNLEGYNPARPATNAANSIKTDAAGNKYMMLQTWPGMFRQDDAGSIVIKYSYDGTPLVYTINSFGGFDYYNAILNSETESDELKTLIANMAKASEQFSIAKESTVSSGLTKLMETEVFKKYVKDFEIPADASNAALYEKMAKDGYVTEIALATNGGITGLTMGVKVNGEYGFKMDSMTAREYNIPVVAQWREDKTGYIFMHNFRAYGINNEFKIDVYEKVTYKSGAVEKFEGKILATYEGWTLAGYINDNAETLTADQLAYAKAIYSYACATEAYLNWRQANGLTIWS